MAISRAEAQASRCANTQCPRRHTRKSLRARMWQNRGTLTSSALWNSASRKPGYGRTWKNILGRLEKAEADAKKDKADRKTINALQRLVRMFVPKAKLAKKAQRGH